MFVDIEHCIRNNNELQKSLNVPVDEEESRKMCVRLFVMFGMII